MRNRDLPAVAGEVAEWGEHPLIGADGKEAGHYVGSRTVQHAGLTKREAAAIAAMQGLLANPSIKHQARGSYKATDIAYFAVMHADALFDALEGGADGE